MTKGQKRYTIALVILGVPYFILPLYFGLNTRDPRVRDVLVRWGIWGLVLFLCMVPFWLFGGVLLTLLSATGLPATSLVVACLAGPTIALAVIQTGFAIRLLRDLGRGNPARLPWPTDRICALIAKMGR